MNGLLVILAAIMGAASAVQGATNGTLSGRVGLRTAVFVNALVVCAGATIAWLAAPRSLRSDPASPWWLYMGGLYGLTIIAGAAFTFPRLGAGATTAWMVAAQLVTALALDHYGIPAGRIEVTSVRLVGACLLLVGAVLVLWPKIAR